MQNIYTFTRRALKTLSFALVRSASLFLAPAMLFGTGQASCAAPGDLDLSFNGTGYKRIIFPGGYDFPTATTVQGDGKIVVVGWTGGAMRNSFLVRFNADGTPDTAFGNGGKVITTVAGDHSRATGVKIQADGKIVVCGWVERGDYHDTQMVVMRHLSDGALDTTFSGDGIRLISVTAGGYNQANGLVIQPDGKIVLGGRSGFMPDTNFTVVRLNGDSSLDTSFARDGAISLDFDGDQDCAEAVALQGDGKIVVAGWSKGSAYYRPAVARCSASGSWDAGFGDGGKVVPNVGINARGMALALQSHVTGTRIVVAGYRGVVEFDRSSGSLDGASGCQMMMLRFQSDGDPDTTFSGDGMVLASFPAGENVATAVFAGGTVAEPTLLMSGFTGTKSDGPGPDLDVAAARFTNNGSPDTSFGGDGVVTMAHSANSRDRGLAAAQANGKLIIAGATHAGTGAINGGNDADLALTRLNSSNGTPDTTFNFDGVATMDVGPAGSRAFDLLVQNDGRIAVAGDVESDVAVARVLSSGAMDNTFNFDGIFTTNYADVAYCRTNGLALQPDGKMLLAGFTHNSAGVEGQLALARVTTTGSPDFGFGDGGKLIAPVGDESYGYSVAAAPGGSFYVAGRTFLFNQQINRGFLLALFNAVGDLMDSISLEIGDSSEAYDLVVQPDGKVVVIGSGTFDTSGGDSERRLAVARFVNQSGKLGLDPGFGSGGIRVINLNLGYPHSTEMTIDGQGRIIVAGTIYTVGGIVVRLTPDGNLDNTFSGNGWTSPMEDVYFNAVAVQSDGMILAAGNDAEKAVVVRLQSNGSLSQNYGVNGVARVALGTYSAYYNPYISGVAVDAQGRAVICGSVDGTMVVARLRGNLSYTGWAGDSFQGLSQADTLATSDPDRDGVPNSVEFMLNTDPLKPTPHPVEIVRDGSRVKVAFSVRSDLVDAVPEVTWTEDLAAGNWQVVPLASFTAVTTGDVTRYEFTPVMTGAPSRFYRLGAKISGAP